MCGCIGLEAVAPIVLCDRRFSSTMQDCTSFDHLESNVTELHMATASRSDLVSIENAAARLGLRPVTVRQWANRRLIERVKLGRRVLISEREIERLISENTIPRLPERGVR